MLGAHRQAQGSPTTQSIEIKEKNNSHSVLVPELEDSPKRLANEALATKGNVFVNMTYKIE